MWILPLARAFAWMRVEGREHLRDSRARCIFAANHQSFMDGPVIMAALPARWRYRVAPAMAKEMFEAHFFPAEHGRARLVHQQPQLLSGGRCSSTPFRCRSARPARGRRCGTSASCSGDGISVLIFPEGRRTETGDDRSLPARHRDDRVAAGRAGRAGPARGARQTCCASAGGWPRPGRVRVAFGAPLRLAGDDYEALAKQVEDAVRAL